MERCYRRDKSPDNVKSPHHPSRSFVEVGSGAKRRGSQDGDEMSNPHKKETDPYGHAFFEMLKNNPDSKLYKLLRDAHEIQGKVRDIAREVYGKDDVFVCMVGDELWINNDKQEFVSNAKNAGYDINEARFNSSGNVKVRRFVDCKETGSEIEVKVLEGQEKLTALEEERKIILEEIREYDSSLSGNNICGCKVNDKVNDKVYIAGDLNGLSELLGKNKITITAQELSGLKELGKKKFGEGDKYRAEFISLSEIAVELKQKVEVKERDGKATKRIIELEKELHKRDDVEKSPEGEVLYPYRVVFKGGNGQKQSEVRYYKSQEEVKGELGNGIENMKVGDSLKGLTDKKLSDGREVESIEYIGLDQRLRELEIEAIKEKVGKLGRRSDINDDALSDLNNISLWKYKHGSKVYIATSDDLLNQRLSSEGVPSEAGQARVFEKLEGLKGLDSAIEDLEGEIQTLNKHKQDAAKAIFGSEKGKDAFILRISGESIESTESTKKSICMVKKDEQNGEIKWVAYDDAGIEAKISEGGEIVCSKTGDDGNEVRINCERLNLYEEVTDIEGRWQKLSEEVKKLYVTGDNSDSNSDLYAHKIGDNIYITQKPELNEEDLRKLRRQCCEGINKENWGKHVKEGDINTIYTYERKVEEAKKDNNSGVVNKSKLAEKCGVKHNIGLDEAYEKLKEQAKPEQDEKGSEQNQNVQKVDGVDGKKADEQVEQKEEQKKDDISKIAEIYNMKPDESFYAYEVVNVIGLSDEESAKIKGTFGVFTDQDDTLKGIKDRFNLQLTGAKGGEELKGIDINDTVEYIGQKEGQDIYIRCKRINASDLLKLEKEQVKDIVKLNKHLGGSDTIKGIDKAKAEDKDKKELWESIRCYKINGQYEVAENPTDMADRIVKQHLKLKVTGEGKIVKDGGQEVEVIVGVKSIDGLAKKIREGGSLEISCEGSKPITIEGVEQSEMRGEIEKEIKGVTDEIIGKDKLLRRYYKARDLRDSLAANNSLNVKLENIHHGSSEFENWKSVHATVVTDEKGKGKIMFARGEGKLENGGISLKDAMRRLEKLVEKKEVPIKIGEQIGMKLEGEIMQALGISDQDRKGKEIKYCLNPPKYVFKCIDREGRETYYFTNDKKGPGKKEGMKKATEVDLDSKALEALKKSIEQGNVKIINLKDIYMFKKGEKDENNGILYITNNGKFGNTPYGIHYCPVMGKQINDFMDDTDDSDKKGWWSTILSWVGDKSENKDQKYDEDRDDDDDYNRNSYGSYYRNPWDPNNPYR